MTTPGRKRTVYAMEVFLAKPDGSEAKPLAKGFWENLHNQLGQMPAADRRFDLGGLTVRGSIRNSGVVYLGRDRDRSDWPHTSTDDEQPEVPLQVDGHLTEPMFVLPLAERTSNLAFFVRTSGGPTWSAAGRWLTRVLKMKSTDGTALALRPFTRSDVPARIARSAGAMKLSLALDRGQTMDRRTKLGRAVAGVRGIAGSATVNVDISFGNLVPSPTETQELLDAVIIASQTPGLKHAEATLLVPDSDGNLHRDPVDLLKDRVSIKVQTNETGRDPFDETIAYRALSAARDTFRAEFPNVS